MARKIDFEPKKWIKERKNKENVRKQLKGKDTTLNSIKALIEREQKIASLHRDYQWLYSSLQLKYKLIAGKCNLIDKDEKACIDYMYLSSISGILSKLFDTQEEKKDRELTDAKNSVWNFDYALLQLYAISQPFPTCIHEIDHIYIKLFQGQFEQVEMLLSQLGTQMDEKEPYNLYVSGLIRNCIKAIMQKDSKALQEELIKAYQSISEMACGIFYVC